MLDLDQSQRDAIGLNFVLSHLTPDSPYGMKKKKQLAPFARNERQELGECFHNISQAINVVQNNEDAFNECRRLLMSLNNIRGIVRKCEASYLHEVELFEVKKFLLLLEKLTLVFTDISRGANFEGISLKKMDDALFILDPDGVRLSPFSIDNRSSPALAKIRRDKACLEARLRELDADTNKNEWDDINNRRFLLAQQEEAEETLVMKQLSAALRVHVDDFYHNMESIGVLDLIIAKALLAIRFEGIRPRINDGERVYLEQMSNPHVADELERRGKSFTKISVEIKRGVTLITGANMGGKSVALKTAALNVALCQLGFFVFARDTEMPLFDGIRFLCGDLQNSRLGLSTFGAEILCLKEIAATLKTKFLFIALDEFARGTNPEEGAAIVRAVASYLSASQSICLMTTHYDRIASPKFSHYRIAGLTKTAYEILEKKLPLMEIEQNGERGIDLVAEHMDYTLVETTGKTTPSRDAMNICKLIGLDKDIIDKIESQLVP